MTDYILNISVDKLKPNPLNETIYSFNQQDHDELKKSVENYDQYINNKLIFDGNNSPSKKISDINAPIIGKK